MQGTDVSCTPPPLCLWLYAEGVGGRPADRSQPGARLAQVASR